MEKYIGSCFDTNEGHAELKVLGIEAKDKIETLNEFFESVK